MSEKSILEQALLQVQNLEEAVKQNAKGILASTMKEELSDLLKESLEEEVKVDATEEEVATEPKEEEEKDMSEQFADEEEKADEDSEDNSDLDNEEPAKGIDDMDSEHMDSEDEESSDDSEGEEEGEDEMDSDDDDVMDMTGASDEEVLKVFKAMKPEDGIVVKKDGNKVELEAGGEEFIIKLDEEEEESNEETLYEIELDEEEEETNEGALQGLSNPKKVEAKEGALKGMSNPKKVEAKEEEWKEEEKETKEEKETEVDEASRTFAADVRTPANQGKKYKAGRHEMNEEVETLKKEIVEYKKALVLFKEKFNEIAVFNANLAHATRLFTEHSTTKQEKLDILKRFDSVATINESKNLFNQIKGEFGTKTTVTETVAEKIANTPQTSSSQEVLAESKAYENPQFTRMRDLMKKVK